MPRDRKRLLRIALVVAVYALLVFAGQTLSDWALDQLEMDLRPSSQARVHQTVMIATGLYVLLLMLPFMPGVEIGLGLMLMLGPSVCFLVYSSTVIALVLAFAIGRLVPPQALIAAFRAFRLERASDMVARLATLSLEDRLGLLLSHVPVRFLGFLLRHRYVALAVLLNIPGNALVGGGGGIALASGLSRLFSVPGFVATVVLAVSPVPLLYYLTGGFR